MTELRCPACSAARDADDNFCRRCGRQIIVNLPALRETRLPVEVRGMAPLAGSVALLALGTGAEWLARRLATGAARAAGRALAGMTGTSRAPQADPAVRVEEILYIRQVNVRR